MGIEQAKYPGQRVIFTEKVDHETEVIAEHVNALQNEVQAIEQFIGLQSDLPAIPGTPASTNSIASRLKGLLDLVSTKASIVHSHAGEYAAPQHTHTAGEVSGIPSVPVLASGSSVARIGGYSTLSIPLPAGRFSSPPTVVFSNGDYNAAPYHLALVDGTVTTTGFVVVAVPAMPNSIAHAAALAEWVAKHRSNNILHTHKVPEKTDRADGHQHVFSFYTDEHQHILIPTTGKPDIKYPNLGDPVRVNWIAMA